MYKAGLLVIVVWLSFASALQSASMTTRERDIIEAAAIYTAISFSETHRQARRDALPLGDEEYKKLDRLLPPRFQACMEGGFSIAFPKADDARILRQLMQSVVDVEVEEPANAKKILQGFRQTNQWCSGRISLWTSAILN